MINLLPRPVIIAHRGASAHAPENTLSAIELALEQGADAVEFDVQLTSDKKVVVIHDSTIDRTTDGSGKVKDLSLSSLQEYNAAHAYGSDFPNEIIPSLEDVFDRFSSKTYFNIELKYSASTLYDLPLMVAKIIANYQLENRVLISSFNPLILAKIDDVLPGVWKGLLRRSPKFGSIRRFFPFLIIRYQSIHLSFSSLNKRTVDYYQQLGKLVFAYTINQPKDIMSALSIGIDGILTDDPALARRTISQL